MPNQVDEAIRTQPFYIELERQMEEERLRRVAAEARQSTCCGLCLCDLCCVLCAICCCVLCAVCRLLHCRFKNMSPAPTLVPCSEGWQLGCITVRVPMTDRCVMCAGGAAAAGRSRAEAEGGGGRGQGQEEGAADFSPECQASVSALHHTHSLFVSLHSSSRQKTLAVL